MERLKSRWSSTTASSHFTFFSFLPFYVLFCSQLRGSSRIYPFRLGSSHRLPSGLGFSLPFSSMDFARRHCSLVELLYHHLDPYLFPFIKLMHFNHTFYRLNGPQALLDQSPIQTAAGLISATPLIGVLNSLHIQPATW